jgi:serine/threonine-protein kinase
MAISTSDSFVKALGQVPVLDSAQLEAVSQELAAKYGEPKRLAAELVKRGWLTAYQARYVLAGQPQALVLGPYLLIDRIGEGMAGKVYKARHTPRNLIVALKVLHKETLEDPELLGRFKREIEVAAALSHPNIVRAYEAGTIGGTTHFLAMEFVDGTDLEKMVKDKGSLPADQACNYIRQACLGLHQAQEKGLVHRDIKPSNLLVSLSEEESLNVTRSGGWPTPWGVVKILDLGLARITPTPQSTTKNLTVMSGCSVMLGTPDFMAPEQALDFASADARSDIYSLGCTFYYLLTGSLVFPGGTLPEKLIKHQAIEPKPIEQFRSDLPAELLALVRKMMAKDPKDRQQSPGEVTRELTRLIARLDPSKATPPLQLKKKPDTFFQSAKKEVPPPPAKKPEPAKRKKESTVHLPASANPFADLDSSRRDTSVKTDPTRKDDSRPTEPDAPSVFQEKLKNLTGADGEMPTWLARLTLLTQNYGIWIAAGAGILIVLFLVLYVLFAGGGSPDAPPDLVKDGPVSTRKEEPVYLCDLPAVDVKVGHGTLGKRGDLGYDNQRVAVKGLPSNHALSMHPPRSGSAKVGFVLGKNYETFKATVAINDSADQSESTLTFIVWGDGKELWRSRGIKNRGDTIAVSVPVKGVERLDLEVHCPGGNNKAHAVWVDPYVTR